MTSTELFNLTTGSWLPGPTLPTAGTTGVTLVTDPQNGNLILAGGSLENLIRFRQELNGNFVWEIIPDSGPENTNRLYATVLPVADEALYQCVPV